jgi:hypothetical protein
VPHCQRSRSISRPVMRAIFGKMSRRTTCLWIVGGTVLGCGSHHPVAETTPGPNASRVLPLAQLLVLATSGRQPDDTSVTFTTGSRRVIVLRQGPPENVVFAEITFGPRSFGDSGRSVQVDVRPRPGIYGLDLTSSIPLGQGATVAFRYPRYFSAPPRAREVYGSDIAYERALAVGRLQPEDQVLLLPSTRPASDNLQAAIPSAGSYLVAAPQ